MGVDADDLRSRLLVAAEELIASRGVASVSLREVARSAGASHAAPGHIFGDKRGLLTAVATGCFVRFGDHVEHRAMSGATGFERLVLAGVTYVEYAISDWPLFEFMYRVDLVDDTDPAYADAATRSYRLLADAVEVAQAEGWSPDADPSDLIQLCWALAHGLAALQMLPAGTTTASATESIDDVERIIRLQLAGLDATRRGQTPT